MGDEGLSYQALNGLRLGKLKAAVSAWSSMQRMLKRISEGGEGATAEKLKRATAAADWSGANARVTKDFAQQTAEQVTAMATHAKKVHKLLDKACTDLAAQKSKLKSEVAEAAKKDILVLSNGTIEPDSGDVTQEAVNAVKSAIDRILVEAGRANATAREGLKQLADDPYAFGAPGSGDADDPGLFGEIGNAAKDQVTPPDGGLELAAWKFDHGVTGAGTALDWHEKVGVARYTPPLHAGDSTFLDRAHGVFDKSNWHMSEATPETKKLLVRGGTGLSILGAAAGGGMSARDQWQQDEGKGYGTAERTARATARGGASGGGALAGGYLGAKVGAGIGSMGGPVGTVVGGLVGGAVGGAIGSGVGEELADHVVDAAGNVGDAIGDGVDKLKFWE